MSTYVMSDIHGHYRSFMGLLDTLALTSDDQVYILGDVIDRGPNVAALLVACVKLSEEYPNFHFLLGNHEHMAYQYLQQSKNFTDDAEKAHWIEKVSGSEQTIEAIDALDDDWVQEKLIGWFDELIYYDIADVAGQKWMLVHAGFDPARFNTDKTTRFDDVIVEGGFGAQSLHDMIWIREKWIYDNREAPLPTVHGHTPTDFFASDVDALEAAVGESCYLSRGGILYYKNKIDIDCGAGAGLGVGCLRLDDFQEFHKKIS